MTNSTKTYHLNFPIVHDYDYECPGPFFRSALEITYTDLRVGGDNPKFRELISLGLNATNGLLIDNYDFNIGQLSWHLHLDRSQIECSGLPYVNINGEYPLWPSPSLSHIDAPDLYNLATGRLLKKLREHQTKFKSGVFLAELGETFRMIRSPLKTLKKSVDRYLRSSELIRRGHHSWSKRRIKQAGSDINNLYLEYRFGWSPLIEDVKDGLKAYQDLSSRRPATTRLRTSCGTVCSESPTSDSVDIFTLPITRHGKKVTNNIYKMVIAVYEEISKLTQIKQSLGLDPFDNFVPTVYELIPFSFVIDYFTNIGQIIEQSCQSVNSVSWGVKTLVQTTTIDFTASLDEGRLASPLYTVVSANLQPTTVTRKSITRSALAPADLRSSNLTFKMPSPTAKLNIASLLAARLRT